MVIASIAILILLPWVGALIGWISFKMAAVVALFIVLGCLATIGGRRLWEARTSRKLEVELLTSAERLDQDQSPDAQLKLEELRTSFAGTMRELRQSQLGGGGRRALYALPWYVVIGPPGVGKTTAIGRSGLKFPLRSATSPIRGIGGTRNCEWWLANEAVIIDTAGRYTADVEDHGEWLEFLGLLKRYRGRAPLNGVIVAVSTEHVYRQDEGELSRHARQIRTRIDEIQRQLGIVVPVYVMLTKCDLLPGFSEVFGELEKSKCDEAFGVTWDSGQKPLEGLLEQVQHTCLTRLQECPRLEDRDQIYRFAHNFGALLHSASQLIDETFATSAYEENPRLRGVYFTSALQEGSPIDDARGSLAQAFGVSLATSEAKPSVQRQYFLRRLFPEKIFTEAGLVARSARRSRRRATVRRATAIAMCACLAGLSLGSGLVARAVGLKVRVAERSLGEASVLLHRGQLSEGFRELELLHDVAREPAATTKVFPEIYSSSALKRIVAGVRQTRLEAVATFCVEPAIDELATELQGQPSRELLAAIQLLFHNTEQLVAFHDWYPWLVEQVASRTIDGCRQQDVAWYLRTTRGSLEPPEQLDRLVEAAKSQILTAEQQLLPPLSRLCAETDELDISLSQVIRDDATVVSEVDVPGCFTRAGRALVEERLAVLQTPSRFEASWVAPTPKRQAGWQRDLSELGDLYTQTYIRQWNDFVEGVSLREFADEQLPVVLRAYMREPGPVERVLKLVEQQTQFERGTSLQKLALPPTRSSARDTKISLAFVGLLSLAKGGDDEQASLVSRHREFTTRASDALAKLAGDPDAADSVSSELQELVVETQRLVAQHPQAAQALAQRLLVGPLRRAQVAASHSKGAWIQSRWCGDVVAPIEREIQKKYPFTRDTDDEVSGTAFAKLVVSRGYLWRFYTESLVSLLPETGRDGFRRSRQAGGRKLLRKSIESFYTSARDVQTSWGGGEAETPTLELELMIHPTPSVGSVHLQLGDKNYEYHNGQETWHYIKYSPTRLPARLSITGKNFEQTIYGDGEWSLLRLLDQGRVVESDDNQVVIVEFPVHGLSSDHPRISIRLLGGAGEVARRRELGSSGEGLLGLFRNRVSQPPKRLATKSKGCHEIAGEE